MAKVTVDIAKESTSQEIKGMLTPQDLTKINVCVTDFLNDEIVVTKGAIDKNARKIVCN